MATEAYARFGHPAVTPLVQIGPNRWMLELFHGPTLAFKDVAMQLLGPAHGPRARPRAAPRDDRRCDLGRYGRRGDRGVPRLAARRRGRSSFRRAASPTCSGA